MIKKCKKCNIEKEFAEFYTHKNMADGYLNECKECTRARMHENWETGNGKVVDKKRQFTVKRKEYQKKFSALQRIKWKDKRRARSKFWNKFKRGLIPKSPCLKCNTEYTVEAHHPDYNKPYDVMWLCSLHHKEWHRNNNPILPFDK